MKTKMNTTRKALSVIILMGLLAGAFALAFPMAVSAQGEQPPAVPTTTPQKGEQQTARLEKLYQRELKASAAQSTRLDKVDGRVPQFQARIDALKGQGKDVTSLQTLLNTFKTNLQGMHADHQAAVVLLNTHAGFDASGKVIDPQLARQTVKDAGQALRQVHQDLRKGLRELLKAIRDFVRDNRGK